MISIREATFESNSSSCHSLTVCSRKTYDDWANEHTILDPGRKEFVLKTDLYDNCIKGFQERFTHFSSKSLSDWEKHIFDELLQLKELNISKEQFYDSLPNLIKELDGVLYEGYVNEYQSERLSDMDKAVLTLISTKYRDGLLTTYGFENVYEDEFETFTEHHTVDETEIVVFGYYGFN